MLFQPGGTARLDMSLCTANMSQPCNRRHQEQHALQAAGMFNFDHDLLSNNCNAVAVTWVVNSAYDITKHVSICAGVQSTADADHVNTSNQCG